MAADNSGGGSKPQLCRSVHQGRRLAPETAIRSQNAPLPALGVRCHQPLHSL